MRSAANEITKCKLINLYNIFPRWNAKLNKALILSSKCPITEINWLNTFQHTICTPTHVCIFEQWTSKLANAQHMYVWTQPMISKCICACVTLIFNAFTHYSRHNLRTKENYLLRAIRPTYCGQFESTHSLFACYSRQDKNAEIEFITEWKSPKSHCGQLVRRYSPTCFILIFKNTSTNLHMHTKHIPYVI